MAKRHRVIRKRHHAAKHSHRHKSRTHRSIKRRHHAARHAARHAAHHRKSRTHRIAVPSTRMIHLDGSPYQGSYLGPERTAAHTPMIIRVSSQKGGVGKTTIAVNLSSALSQMGYKILLIDGDTVNPAIDYVLGMDEQELGIRDVLTGRINITEAIRRHDETGVYVLPGLPSGSSFLPTPQQLRRFAAQMKYVRDFDFVIIDTPPGFFGTSVESLYEEALIITIPSPSSAASAVRLGEFYDERDMRHELIINRAYGKRYELSVGEIEKVCGRAAVAVFPEDVNVLKGEEMHTPTLILNRRAPFSKATLSLAKVYATKRGTPETMPAIQKKHHLLDRLLGE